MTINFDQIKQDLINKGLLTADAAEKSDQKIISVTGEFSRSGNLASYKVKAGWKGQGMPFKGEKIEYSLDEVEQFNEDYIKAKLQKDFPGCLVKVSID